MVMSSKKIGKMVGADVNKALANINASTPKPDMKGGDTELKAAVAPKKAPTFGEAFKAARASGDKTFTFGGKSYTTKMAGDGAKKAAPKGGSTASTSKSPLADFYLNKYPKIKGNAANIKGVSLAESAAAQAKAGRSNVTTNPKPKPKSPVNTGRSEGFLSRFGKSDTGKSFTERQQQKYGKAKGGSVDGCAIRGKTRAPMKKGK